VHGGRINMNNEKEFKISNEDISINLSEDEKKDEYKQPRLPGIKDMFESRLKYYSRYLK